MVSLQNAKFAYFLFEVCRFTCSTVQSSEKQIPDLTIIKQFLYPIISLYDSIKVLITNHKLGNQAICLCIAASV